MHQPTLAVLSVFVNLLPTNGAFCLILANVIIELALLCSSFVNAPLLESFKEAIPKFVIQSCYLRQARSWERNFGTGSYLKLIPQSGL
jgi:hypothetical protein